MEQIELYWEMASRIDSMVTIGISACLFAKFLKLFLKQDRFAWEAGGAYALAMLIAYYVPWEMLGMSAEAIGLGAAFLVVCIRDRNDRMGHINIVCFFRSIRNLEQKIFLVVIMYLIEWFAHGISHPFRNILFQIILFSPKIMSMHSMLYFSFYVVIELLYIIVRFILMFFLFRMIDHVYIYKRENMSKKELGLLLSIPLSVLSGYIAFTFFYESYLADIQQYIQENHSGYDWVKALYQVISFAAIFSAIVLHQKIKESYRQEKEKAVLEEQTENMKRHMEKVEALYQNIRGLKHDMGNHVMILENLCQNNQQEAIGYLSALRDELREITSPIRTGNPVTDVIISEKEEEAQRKGIDFISHFYYPKGCTVNVFDVSIILSNAIGNAIEGAAACKKPFIQIRSYQERNAYLIEFRNNFAGELLLDGESKMPVTTKDNREEHGFGLANIQRVAHKYFGNAEVRYEGEIFILNVMLMLK